MDIKKLSASELRNAENKQLLETEESIRRKLQENRLEAFLAASPKTGEQRMLKRSLARVLTVRNERLKGKAMEGGSK